MLINYVDGTWYFCDSENTRKIFGSKLSKIFVFKLIGEAKRHLGMKITQKSDNIIPDQKQYAKYVSTRLRKAFKNTYETQEN